MLQPDDVVPRLRQDLRISQGAGEDGIFEVEAPDTGLRTALHDFELSMARLLNGQRTVQDVVDSGGQLGIPLTLDGVASFIKKLRVLGFLEADGKVSRTGTTWDPRAEWSPEIRNLFQEAVRHYRADQPSDARSYLQALLAKAPGLPEAEELMVRVEARLTAEGSAVPPPSFAQVYNVVENSWFEAGDSGQFSIADDDKDAGGVDGGPRRSVLKPALVVLGVLAGLGVGLLFVPFSDSVRAQARLRSRVFAQVVLPRAGVLADVRVQDGQKVEKGSVLAAYETPESRARLDAASAKLAQLTAQGPQREVDPKLAAKAKAALDKAQADLRRAQGELDKLRAKSRGRRTAAVAKAEKKVAQAQAAVERAQRPLEPTGKPDTAAHEQKVQAATREREAAMAALAVEQVIAPEAGEVRGLSARAGQTVGANEVLARLEDPTALVLAIDVSAPQRNAVKVGMPVAVTILGKPLHLKVTQVTDKGVEASVDNADGRLKSGMSGEATVDLGARSTFARW